MVLTKKVATELRKQKAEQELRESIIDYCQKYGFTCRFLYESVIITTTISSWQFAYHENRITLRHESTTKINFKTGDYAKTHEQFRNKKMTFEEVIDYIAKHDKYMQEIIYIFIRNLQTSKLRIPVYKPGLSPKTGKSRYDTKHVPCCQMH